MSGMERALRRAVRWMDRLTRRVSGGRWRVWDVAEAVLTGAVIFGIILALAGAGSIDCRIGDETTNWWKIIAGLGLILVATIGLKDDEEVDEG